MFHDNFKKYFHLILIGCAVFIAIVIGYYFLYLVPQQNQAKLEFEQKQYLDNSQKETDAMIEESNRQKRLKYCLDMAEVTYSQNWAKNCKSEAEKNRKEYQNCLDTFSSFSYNVVSPEVQCAWHKDLIDSSEDCSLPSHMADSLGEFKEEMKDECFRLNGE